MQLRLQQQYESSFVSALTGWLTCYCYLVTESLIKNWCLLVFGVTIEKKNTFNNRIQLSNCVLCVREMIIETDVWLQFRAAELPKQHVCCSHSNCFHICSKDSFHICFAIFTFVWSASNTMVCPNSMQAKTLKSALVSLANNATNNCSKLTAFWWGRKKWLLSPAFSGANLKSQLWSPWYDQLAQSRCKNLIVPACSMWF